MPYSQPSTKEPMITILQPNLMLTSTAPRANLTNEPTPIFHYNIKCTDKPEYTNLGPWNPFNDVPISIPSTSNMFITRFINSENDDILTVILLGDQQIPDVSAFASRITCVEFVGHLSYAAPIFEIVSQLPLVKKVKIVLGKSQLPVFQEFHIDDNIDSCNYCMPSSCGHFDLRQMIPAPLCPEVEELEIIMDLECYYYPTQEYAAPNCGNQNNYRDMTRTAFDALMGAFFRHARNSFYNLKKLRTRLPDSDLYFGGLNVLVESCRFLKDKVSIRHREEEQGMDIFNNFSQMSIQSQGSMGGHSSQLRDHRQLTWLCWLEVEELLTTEISPAPPAIHHDHLMNASQNGSSSSSFSTN